MDFDAYQTVVIQAAKRILARSGITQVCLDTIRESYDSQRTIEEAAETAADDTFMWES